MIIIELSYIKPLEQIKQHLDQHRFFLDKYYSEGIFILSGPKNPRNGGVILAMTDKETAERLVREDPFYQHGLADYHFTEWLPNKSSACLQQYL